MHHLQIMESLGGDQSWFDRFVAGRTGALGEAGRGAVTACSVTHHPDPSSCLCRLSFLFTCLPSAFSPEEHIAVTNSPPLPPPTEHSAIAYYWLLIFFYLVNPKLAYNFMQRVELHAMDTYAVFVEANRERLDALPPPTVALKYYLNEDLYLVSCTYHLSGGRVKGLGWRAPPFLTIHTLCCVAV